MLQDIDDKPKDDTNRVEKFYGKDRFLQPNAPMDAIKVYTYNVSRIYSDLILFDL